jgi:site-specific DNA-methyltransferase (adenine-specific)
VAEDVTHADHGRGADWQDGSMRVLAGDCRVRLRELADASVDALVTDPPAGISFLGRDWDTFPTRRRPAGCTFADGRTRPGISGGQEHRPQTREAFVAFMTGVMAECLRVLKPGAHGLVWALPRTAHWTATALEQAGFEIHPNGFVAHLFASGWPKSRSMRGIGRPELGTGLKPALECWWLVRKPLSEPNVAANVLVRGTGALNVDGCRIGTGLGDGRDGEASAGRRYGHEKGDFVPLPGPRGGDARGRWPANLVLSHAEGWRPAGTRRVRTGVAVRHRGVAGGSIYGPTAGRHRAGTPDLTYAGVDGLEAVDAWDCVEGCPVAELDRQSGQLASGFMAAGTLRDGLGYQGDLGSHVRHDTHGDRGGASRFFYVAKADATERSAGLPPRLANRHATVKPVDLMRHLCRLVTPPGGVVLDCFAGSGTTLVAARLEGFQGIGIERDRQWLEVIRARCAWAAHQPGLPLLEVVVDQAARDKERSELEALQRVYRTDRPGAFMREALRRWPALVAEVEQLRAQLRACGDHEEPTPIEE